jgi:amino acid transporter
MSDIVTHDAPAAHDDTKTSATAVSAEADTDNAFKDTKKSDAEQNHSTNPNPGELKRKLKSRHLQMIAIGRPSLCTIKTGYGRC